MKDRIFIVLASLAACLALTACGSAGISADRCATPPALVFDTSTASSAPALNCFAGCLRMSIGKLGKNGADTLAANLQSTNTFCALPVSPDTASLIQQANEQRNQKNDNGALDLLRSVLTPNPDSTTAQIARDALALAGAAQTAGGNPQLWIDPAARLFQDNFSTSLSAADRDATLRLAQEAALLGLTVQKDQALNRARQIATDEMNTGVADFVACGASQKATENVLQQVQIAALLGVDSDILIKAEAAARTKGDVVVKRLMDSKAQACQLTGTVEVIYAKIATPTQETPIQVQVTFPFDSNLTAPPYLIRGEGHLNGQTSLSLGEMALMNTVDMTLVLDGDYHPSNPSTPLRLQFQIRGNDISSLLGPSNAVSQLELPPNWTDVTYDLVFPLQDGAQMTAGKTWKNTSEWTFILHLTAQPAP